MILLSDYRLDVFNEFWNFNNLRLLNERFKSFAMLLNSLIEQIFLKLLLLHNTVSLAN